MAIRSTMAALVLLCAGFLAACASPIVDQTGPLSIRQVAVTTRPDVKSATPVGPAIQSAASATVVRETPDGLPAKLHISVDRVTYKNAMMSLLVGSANSINTTVSITDDSGKVVAQFPHAVVADAMVNGIIGAAIAATQDPAAVDQAMTAQYASQLRDRIYGRPGHKPKKAAQKIATPAPAAAAPVPTVPAPQSKPALPTS